MALDDTLSVILGVKLDTHNPHNTQNSSRLSEFTFPPLTCDAFSFSMNENENMVDNSKDIAIAILGASVGLAGLLLIFSGLLFSQAAALPKDTTPDEIIDHFRNGGRVAFWPFLFSLLIAGLCLAWLLHPNPMTYCLAWILFTALLVVTAIYGFWVTQRLL
jgi:hypothetical protein